MWLGKGDKWERTRGISREWRLCVLGAGRKRGGHWDGIGKVIGWGERATPNPNHDPLGVMASCPGLTKYTVLSFFPSLAYWFSYLNLDILAVKLILFLFSTALQPDLYLLSRRAPSLKLNFWLLLCSSPHWLYQGNEISEGLRAALSITLKHDNICSFNV